MKTLKMKNRTTEPIFIVVAGGIGVGKTTFGNELSKNIPKSHFFIEDVGKNPYLSLFYQDMKAWGFHSRIAYLAMKTEVYRIIPPNIKYAILDRSVHELGVFAKLQHDLGNLVGNDFSVYWNLYETLVYLSPPPDILIYVKCSEKVSLQRITERARDFEKNISIEYISMVNSYYENWLNTFDSKNVITVNTDPGMSASELAKNTAVGILNKLKE